MKYSLVLLALVITTLFSCNNTPKPVSYGADSCHFCKMTIVDKQHAAQFMTKKGKTFSFDASECMLNHLKEIDKETVSLFLVNDYNDPGEFVDASTASYLISENIPSPMGEYLTAFSSKDAAKEAQEINAGELYQWEELLMRFDVP